MVAIRSKPASNACTLSTHCSCLILLEMRLLERRVVLLATSLKIDSASLRVICCGCQECGRVSPIHHSGRISCSVIFSHHCTVASRPSCFILLLLKLMFMKAPTRLDRRRRSLMLTIPTGLATITAANDSC